MTASVQSLFVALVPPAHPFDSWRLSEVALTMTSIQYSAYARVGESVVLKEHNSPRAQSPLGPAGILIDLGIVGNANVPDSNFLKKEALARLGVVFGVGPVHVPGLLRALRKFR
jgi:hypothetical protein